MPLKINLSQRFLLRISGEDAPVFLQGQITQDVKQLKPGRALLFAHCSPKGRVLFNGYLWQAEDAWWMELPQNRGEFALDRLTRYRLRSRVILQHANQTYWGLIFASPSACDESLEHAHHLGLVAIKLDSTRHLLIHETLPEPWQGFTEKPLEAWQKATLERGIAEITDQTADEWIPQMLNWDQLGGISFDKGCYTGQEIVARTHFLGKVKRSLARFQAPIPLALNQTLWAEGGESAVGKVVMAVGQEALVVLQEAFVDAKELHLDSAAGTTLIRVQNP